MVPDTASYTVGMLLFSSKESVTSLALLNFGILWFEPNSIQNLMLELLSHCRDLLCLHLLRYFRMNSFKDLCFTSSRLLKHASKFCGQSSNWV